VAPGVFIILLAFVCEFFDSSLGMGYGTTLTPLLMALGFEPLQIVPAVLLSELATGVVAGIVHHGFGNVNLRRGSRDLRIMVIMTICGALGVSVAAIVAIRLPPTALKAYIGVLVLAIGLTILLTRGKQFGFSWRKVGVLGLVAAFNKGMSGGGYGPVVTGGQILSGVDSRSAIGIASAAEGLTCVVGVIAYCLSGACIDWGLTPWLMVGAMCSVPLAAYTVKRVPPKGLRRVIGVAATILGLFTLCRIVF